MIPVICSNCSTLLSKSILFPCRFPPKHRTFLYRVVFGYFHLLLVKLFFFFFYHLLNGLQNRFSFSIIRLNKTQYCKVNKKISMDFSIITFFFFDKPIIFLQTDFFYYLQFTRSFSVPIYCRQQTRWYKNYTADCTFHVIDLGRILLCGHREDIFPKTHLKYFNYKKYLMDLCSTLY